jgi:hypothetical protein
MTGRRGRRRKQLLDDLKGKRRYWKLKEAALDRTLWRNRFGRGYGPSWDRLQNDDGGIYNYILLNYRTKSACTQKTEGN